MTATDAEKRRQAAIVGDWTGEVAARQEREAEAYRDLRASLRTLTCDLLKQREFWANSAADGAVARAVAYQSIAGRLIRVLDRIEQDHDLPTNDAEEATR